MKKCRVINQNSPLPSGPSDTAAEIAVAVRQKKAVANVNGLV